MISVSGCSGTDSDFDGPTYGFGGNWPGTNITGDQVIHPEPVMFTSPLFFSPFVVFQPQPYDFVAFENDLPFVEGCSSNATACVNPPKGDRGNAFYPIFSTTNNTAFGGGCNWQFGGPYLPSTTNNFGGNSSAEYGSLLPLYYPSPRDAFTEDYRSKNITPWKFFAPGSPPTGTLTTMVDGNGYWIYMNQADTLLVNGFIIPPASSPPTYSLVQGWNLVGFKPQPTIGSETLGNYLSSINGMYDAAHVFTYDNSAGIWKALSASDSLSVGQAFYVVITTPSGTTLKP